MSDLSGLPTAADHRELVTTSDVAAATATTALTGSLVLPAKTTWFVQAFFANVVTPNVPIMVELRDASANVYARLKVTDDGSFSLDNQGWPVGVQIGPSTSAITLTISAVIAGAVAATISAQANLVRAHDNPTSVHPAS